MWAKWVEYIYNSRITWKYIFSTRLIRNAHSTAITEVVLGLLLDLHPSWLRLKNYLDWSIALLEQFAISIILQETSLLPRNSRSKTFPKAISELSAAVRPHGDSSAQPAIRLSPWCYKIQRKQLRNSPICWGSDAYHNMWQAGVGLAALLECLVMCIMWQCIYGTAR